MGHYRDTFQFILMQSKQLDQSNKQNIQHRFTDRCFTHSDWQKFWNNQSKILLLHSPIQVSLIRELCGRQRRITFLPSNNLLRFKHKYFAVPSILCMAIFHKCLNFGPFQPSTKELYGIITKPTYQLTELNHGALQQKEINNQVGPTLKKVGMECCLGCAS